MQGGRTELQFPDHPVRIHQPFSGGPLKDVAIGREEMEKAIHTYYKMMGWDGETGIPTNEKLAELGISWVSGLKIED